MRFDREVVHIVVAGDIVDHYCFMFDRGVVHIVVAGYVVDRLLFEVLQWSGSHCCGWLYF